MTSPKTVAPMVATVPSSSAEGINWSVLSMADVWDSSRCVTEFLDSLKNTEADWEGIPFIHSDTSIH
jgi:hypothetical protein